MEKKNGYLRMIGYIGLCLFMLFSASACGSDTEVERQYAQTPQDAINMYMTARSENDIQKQFKALGIIGTTSENAMDFEISNIQLRKLTGEEYNSALDGITEYWLNDDNGWEYAYTAFDITEIGYASFTITDKASGESEAIENICVVKTDLGWFLALPSM